MKGDDRFMNELFRIVSGALKLDVDKVRNYTAFLADKLEKAGDDTAAKRLRQLLSESDHTLRPASVSQARALPVDSESRFPLLEKANLKSGEDLPVILDPARWAVVTEFLSVAKSHAQLEAAGVTTPLSMMLYGPPGVGKSRLARHVARELGLDLFVARLDGVVSSFLGSTSKNIRALFEFASRTPCVLFLDEFDAIAKLRGDAQELGELKRVVNSFLQNLDALGPQTIVIAATNHEELLDRAVWRRFSYRLQIDLPSTTERAAMWDALLSRMKFEKRDVAILADLSEGFSGSDIQEAALRLHRRKVTTQVTPDLSTAFKALLNLSTGAGEGSKRFLSAVANERPEVIAGRLRERDEKMYSHATVARLLGVSKATAYRMTV